MQDDELSGFGHDDDDEIDSEEVESELAEDDDTLSLEVLGDEEDDLDADEFDDVDNF